MTKSVKVFEPLKIRNVTFPNRLWLSPMGMFSSKDGHVSDFHYAHYGQFAIHRVGALMIEATAVSPEGRFTIDDNGIWSDEHIPGLKRIVDFAHSQSTVIGIQLWHVGRKSMFLPDDEALAPSAKRHNESLPIPKAMDIAEVERVIEAYGQGARRAREAGFDFIEIHGAHGYLPHQFLSPLSNERTDAYGGSLENRLRFSIEVSARVRQEWGEEKPVFFRVSASDWAEGPERDDNGDWKQWGVEQSTILSKRLIDETGIDLIDVSSGGVWEQQKIPLEPGYQVQFAEHIKRRLPDALITAVGLITEAKHAESILQEGKADAIFLGRELLRNPGFVLKAAAELGATVYPVKQYKRAWPHLENI